MEAIYATPLAHRSAVATIRTTLASLASFAGDVQTPEIQAYLASADAAWDTLAGALTGNEPGPPSNTVFVGDKALKYPLTVL